MENTKDGKTNTGWREEDFFIGGEGIQPNRISSISEEEARQLLDGFDFPARQPAPALIAAFEQRKRNQAKSTLR